MMITPTIVTSPLKNATTWAIVVISFKFFLIMAKSNKKIQKIKWEMEITSDIHTHF